MDLRILIMPILVVLCNLGNQKTIFIASKIKVKDGDTIDAWIGKKKYPIRLAYIDAPELKQKDLKGKKIGVMSKLFLRRRIGNSKLEVRIIGIGHFGRHIGELYVKGKMINLDLVNAGMANIYTLSKFRNIAQKQSFNASQKNAAKKRLGIWENKKFLNPRHYRKKSRP